jgi:regulator of sigma E protease
MSLILFILILAVLILVHELGHFSVAKFFGIKVEEFGIGFPPRLIHKKIGETIYSFNLLFFGGFVKIFGENANEAAQNPRSFAHKSRWIQAAVVVAGIVMNIAFAWLIISVGYMVGLPSAVEHVGVGLVQGGQVMVTGILPKSPAEKAGFQAGDIIETIQTGSASLDTRTLNTSMQSDVVRNFIAAHADESDVILIKRGHDEVTLVAKPIVGLIEGHKALGVQLDDVGTLRLSPPLAFVQGAIITYSMTISTATGLIAFFGQIIRGVADFGGVAGPIGIAGIGAKAVSNGFASAITLTALISINLAVINVLPIPGLDGGRLLIIAIEGVIRRPVPQQLATGLMIAGFAFLIGIMLLVSYHDIAKIIG